MARRSDDGKLAGSTFHVDTSSPVAVYIQIENQIQFAIASGRIRKGQSLPSVRELSAQLEVNPNTITKAYRDLELRGLVHTRRGVGVTVTDTAMRLCKTSTRNLVVSHLRDAVAECVAAGLPPQEVRKLVTETIDRGMAPYAR